MEQETFWGVYTVAFTVLALVLSLISCQGGKR